MSSIIIKKLCEYPELSEKSADWFSQKWGIPVEAYRQSIQNSIEQKNGIPQWYIVLDDNKEIIAGAGMIDNDFHERKDLSPNLCALFVEEKYRRQGIAKHILDFVREDLASMSFEKIYLITDHTGLYEKYDWNFLTTVNDDEGNTIRMYVTPTEE